MAAVQVQASRDRSRTVFLHRLAVIRREDVHPVHPLGIREARTDPAFDLLQPQIGGDHRRQIVEIAVIQQLEEFFLRPGGGVLGAEIVQHQQRHLPDFVEAGREAVVGTFEGSPQPIEQVRRGEEQRGDAVIDGEIGDGRRQMGFAAAEPAFQQEPSLARLAKKRGEVVGQLERRFRHRAERHPPLRGKGFERHVLQLLEIAEPVQPLAGMSDCRMPCMQTHGVTLAEIRIAHRQVVAQIANSAADRAARFAGPRPAAVGQISAR